MTKKNKNIVFYTLLVLFFFGGIFTVFYAQGWRISFENFKISKVGGIYIKSFPSDAQISINNKLIKNQSTFFNAGTFVSDLFPKIYLVELKENGYQNWQENAYVEPSKVFQLASAVLIPQNATTVIQKTISNFSLKNKILIYENNNSLNLNGIKTLKNSILVAQNENGNSIITNTEGKYTLYKIQEGTEINLNTIFSKNIIAIKDISNINFDKQNSSIIILEEVNKIYLINTKTLKVTKLENNLSNIRKSAVAIEYGSLAWAESGNTSTIIYSYDESSQKISSSSPISGKNIQIDWIKKGLLGVVQDDGKLYEYDLNNQATNLIANNVKYFKANYYGSAVAIIESDGFEIISIDGQSEKNYKFNIPNIANIKDIIWYQDLTHIFINYGNYISFLDLKDIALKNFEIVSYGTNPIYSQEENALYLLNQKGNLIKFNFPS